MGGLKVLLILGLIWVVIAFAVTALITLAPYVLAVVIMLAIARMLVRQFGRKDETHSPVRTRPGSD